MGMKILPETSLSYYYWITKYSHYYIIVNTINTITITIAFLKQLVVSNIVVLKLWVRENWGHIP